MTTTRQELANHLECHGWPCSFDRRGNLLVSLSYEAPASRLVSADQWRQLKTQLSIGRTELLRLVATFSSSSSSSDWTSYRCGSVFLTLSTCVRCRQPLEINPRSKRQPNCFCSCSCCRNGEDDACPTHCVGICRASSEKKPCKPIYRKLFNQVCFCRPCDLPKLKPSPAVRQMHQVAVLILMAANRKGSGHTFCRLPSDLVRVILNMAFSPKLCVCKRFLLH